MPPKDNQVSNNSNFEPLKVGIDPVFKGNPTAQSSVEQPPQTGGVSEVLNNQTYTPTRPTPSPSTFSSNIPKSKLSVHTYKDDIASAIEASHLSSINIAVAENEKMHSKLQAGGVETADKEETTGSYSKNKIIIFISLFLVISGVITIGAVYILNSPATGLVTQSQILSPLITVEYRDELNVDSVAPNRFVSALSSKLNDIQIPVNNIYAANITVGTSSNKRSVTAGEFVDLAKFKMPDIVKRTLIPNYTIGMFSFAKDMCFVIFKTSSFENTYAGMLEWEKDIEKDFTQLFRLNGAGDESDLAAALTPTDVHKFEDGVIVNQDVRLLRDSDGKIIFLYGILNKDTIIITVSEAAFKEIVDRLNKEKGLKR